MRRHFFKHTTEYISKRASRQAGEPCLLKQRDAVEISQPSNIPAFLITIRRSCHRPIAARKVYGIETEATFPYFQTPYFELCKFRSESNLYTTKMIEIPEQVLYHNQALATPGSICWNFLKQATLNNAKTSLFVA